MPQANDSILVTPGSGATLATELINSKEHELWLLADAAGHICGGRETFLAEDDTGIAQPTAASTLLSLYNASSTHTLEIAMAMVTLRVDAIHAGLIGNYRLHRITTNVTTGNAAVTPIPLDSNDTLTGSVTANRQTNINTPMTGHTISGIALARGNNYAEETSRGDSRVIVFSELDVGEPIICRQNEGVIIVMDSVGGNQKLVHGGIYFRQRAN